MSIQRIFQRNVDVAVPGETPLAIAERMRQRSVGCLIVQNKAGEPVGIVTDRDLALRVVAEGLDPRTTKVEEIMTPDPQIVLESTPIEDALALMRAGAYRRLPVVDDDGKVAGIVTLDDILMTLAEEFSQAGRLLDRETPRAAAAR